MFRSNNVKRTALILILVILALDLFTKWIIYNYMTPYQIIPVIDNFFNIVYAKNFGSAFSFLSTAPGWFRKPFFFIINIAAMSFIVYIMFRDQKNKTQFLAFASVLGGALGNFLNRIYPGYAIDFLDVKLTSTYHWPSFNVADIAITCGLILVMLDMAKMESKKKRSAKK
jgi:signal peptidase II